MCFAIVFCKFRGKSSPKVDDFPVKIKRKVCFY